MSVSLAKYVDNFFDNMDLSSIDQKDLQSFKKSMHEFNVSGKKQDAFLVYFCYCRVFKIFEYNDIGKLVEFLSDHEYHSGELLKKHRDHYSHSAYVFSLGLSIYANNKNIRDEFYKFYGNDIDDSKFLFYWGIVGLFHDIGYPMQLAHEQIQSYMKNVFKNDLDKDYWKKFPHVTYEGNKLLLSLTNSWKKAYNLDKNSTMVDLLTNGICSRLDYLPKEKVYKLTKDRPSDPNFMDHGYWSALIIANKLMNNFDIEPNALLLDALTAIYLHNSLIRFYIVQKGDDPLPTDISKHPFASLIMLCDELQNWNRESFGSESKMVPLAYNIDISINDNSLHIDFIFNDDFGNYSDGRKEIDKILNGKYKNAILEYSKVPLKLSFDAKEVHKETKENNFASSEKFIDLVDFAVAIHEAYVKYCLEYSPSSLSGWCYRLDKDGNETNETKTFDELDLLTQISNINQAKSYAYKLELVSCFYSDKNLDYPIIKRFSDEDDGNGNKNDLSFLCREEHLRWAKEKISNGFTYSPAKIPGKLTNKCLLPFDCLPEVEKEKDRILIDKMCDLLEEKHRIRIYSYRRKWKETFNIFATGHRDIVNIDDENVREQIREALKSYQKKYRVVVRTCLAYGADLMIAEEAIKLGITVKACIPVFDYDNPNKDLYLQYEDYIKNVKEDALKYGYPFNEDRYRNIFALVVSLKSKEDKESIYYAPMKYCLEKSQGILALWDGVKTLLFDEDDNLINKGGTYHALYEAENSYHFKQENIITIKAKRRIHYNHD